MKFAIVLLGLVAVAAALPQERNIREKVESIVDDAIAKAHDDIDSIKDLVTALTASTKTTASNIVASAKSEVSSTISALESSISSLIAKGGAVAVCAQTNSAELSFFKTTFGTNVDSCVTNLSTSIVAFETEILAEIASLQSAVAELVVIVTECTHNFIDAVVCAVTKTKRVEELIKQIVSDATDAVETARTKGKTTIDDIDTCAKTTIGAATVTLNKYVTAVKQCS